jgi:ribokinase
MASPPQLTVFGSVNLDLVVRCPRLPAPGETISGSGLGRHPGGKGANRALVRACAAGALAAGRAGAPPAPAPAAGGASRTTRGER